MTRTQAFGRYELLDRISAGGMAEVFRARDVQRGSVVALKRILPQVAEDEEFIAMLKDEARICSKLEHPHIARTLDFGDVDGEYFIAFEYVDGRDLRQIYDRAVRDKAEIPLSFLLYVFARIGEGLSYAHHRKEDGETISLVHRDVSPQNIIVSFSGDVKLIDFGIAKARGKMTRTQAGTIKGKFGYMSPEQVKGVDIDHRADIFALGVCMWEMLTRERLFQAENELQVLDRIRTMKIIPPSEKNAQVSPELDRIVLKALAKEPTDRYRAAKDLYRDINALPESTATRDEVAYYMRQAFAEAAKASVPESAEKRQPAMNRVDGGDSVGQKAARQEALVMSATENKGSDLDIFEGLGKKGAAVAQRVSSVPAPPRSGGGLPPPPLNGADIAAAKRTLVGMAPGTAAASAAPASNGPPSQPAMRAAPPPPPGRGSLPSVSAPPSRQGVSGPPPLVPPPAPSTRPGPPPPSARAKSKGGGPGGLDMEWDDEDEATHVFDKSESKVTPAPVADTPPPSSRIGRPRPNALQNGNGLAPPPPPPPPPSAGMRASSPPSQPGLRAASPQSGMGPTSQSPFRPSAPPPPPASQGAFARASGVPASVPPSFGGSTTPMGMPGHQVTTAPLPMPTPPPRQSMGASAVAQRSMEATALVRPQPSRTGLWVALGVAFTAAVAGAVFFLTSPRTGRVVVNVNDPKGVAINRVEIFVDGKKWCDTTPCAIDPVPAGAHEVKVLADGFEVPAARAISVEARKESSLSFALAPAAGRGGTGVKVAGNQPGVKLFVDDREIGPLPAEVRDLAPGSHRVRIVGTDRYVTIEKNVTVAKDEVLDLGPQQLKVVKGKITVTPGTLGAKVYIVSGADRRELPILPISVDIDTSKSWQLEANRIGFNDYRQPVSFDDGQAEKTFVVTLDPRGTVAANSNPTPQPVTAGDPKPAPQPVAAADRPRPKPAPAPDPTPKPEAADPAPAAGGDSFLDINSIPVANVLLDGKPIGTTPKLHVPVTPGAHTVVFVNAEQGLKKSVSVQVGAGETKKAIAKLRATE